MASGQSSRQARKPPHQEDLHSYSTELPLHFKEQSEGECHMDFANSPYYSSFAFIVIFALSTLDTGHPFSAASAYFWNIAASAPGTLPTTSM